MKAKIGVIGGSGFYQLLKNPRKKIIKTPYGKPSDKIAFGDIAKRKVAFLPRHGAKHQYPPHRVPYKANLWSLKEIGVERVISVTACGSLQKKIKRGDFVILDQFVDRTRGRGGSFYDGPKTIHVSLAYPYCRELAKIAYQQGKKLKLKIHSKGILVVIEGPRYSTYAESVWFTKMGWDVINMTGYPEVVLARELEICYAAIALATDYDVGVVVRNKITPVTTEEVIRVFKENNERAQKLVKSIIQKIPEKRSCDCGEALKYAAIN
jgi:5'-methylthioadenosine phosphorylase